MFIQPTTFSYIRGQGVSETFTYGGGAVDITGWAIAVLGTERPGLTPIFTRTTAPGDGVTIVNGPAGQFKLTMPFAITAASNLPAGQYVYEVWRTDSGFETRIGYIIVFAGESSFPITGPPLPTPGALPLAVALGGTGLASYSPPGYMRGNGTTVTTRPLSSVIMATGSDPVYGPDARLLGVSRTKTAAQNAIALQAGIDSLSNYGGTIYIREMYPCDPVILRRNVALANDGPVPLKGLYGRDMPGGTGVTPTAITTPAGGGFVITNAVTSFLRLEWQTGVRNLQFFYPNQNYNSTTLAGLIAYPPTISQNEAVVRGVELTGLTFIGSHSCMDFNQTECSDVVIDLCYGYPLGGRFLRMVGNYDIARISRCHVNPGAGWYCLPTQPGEALPYKYALLDAICAGGATTYEISIADEIILNQCFVFGARTGFDISASYGSVVQCSADMVETGLKYTPGAAHKTLAVTNFNCIPSAGPNPPGRNAFVYAGDAGLLSLVQCRAFLGVNTVIPSSGVPDAHSFLRVQGTGAQRADLVSCMKSVVNGAWTAGVTSTNGGATINQFPAGGV